MRTNSIRETADSQSLRCGLMERTRESDSNRRKSTMAKILFSTLRPENSLELPVCSETLTLPVIKVTTTTTSAALFLLRDMSLSHVWTGRRLF